VERHIINPWAWQDALGFVQANDVIGLKRIVICSGQGSLDADGHPLHTGDMRSQIDQALDNLEAVLHAAGLTLAHVVRLNSYTVDVDGYVAAAEGLRYRLAAAGCRPTVTVLGVSRLVFPEALIELEATAIG
jgi:enamine deaminase RidA (YjgF/YER057c/UK114 family)